METWKDIENYEGLYQISNKGRVRNSRSGRILIQKIKNTDSNSYRLIVLSKNNVKKCHYIHRLVAKAFLPNPTNLPCVNHKDENGENNNVEQGAIFKGTIHVDLPGSNGNITGVAVGE